MGRQKQSLGEGFFPSDGITQSNDKKETSLSRAVYNDPTSKGSSSNIDRRELQSQPRQKKAWEDNIHSLPLDWGRAASTASAQNKQSVDGGHTSLQVEESAGKGSSSPAEAYQPPPPTKAFINGYFSIRGAVYSV